MRKKIVELNPYFQSAIDSTNKMFLSYKQVQKEVYPGIERNSKFYQNNVKDKSIYLLNRTKNEVLRIDYFTRFSEKYQKRILAKMLSIRDLLKEQNNPYCFITLTVDPKRFHSIKQATKEVSKYWNRLLTRIKQEFPKVSYIKCQEFQTGYKSKKEVGTHMPHLHVLLIGIRDINYSWVRKIWKIGRWVTVRKNEDYFRNSYKKAMRYIIKYITKSNEDSVSLNLNWACRSRAFTTSNNIVSLLKGMTNSKLESDDFEYLFSSDAVIYNDLEFPCEYEDFRRKQIEYEC